MKKLITLLIGCSLTLAASVKAEQVDQENKQKSKPVQKQQFAPKQHAVTNPHVQTVHPQHTVTNPHVQTVHPKRTVTNPHVQTVHPQRNVTNPHVQTVHPQHNVNPNNAKIHNNVTKQPLHTVPVVHPNTLPAVQSNKLPPVQTKKLPAVHPNTLPPIQAPHTVKNIRPQYQNFHAAPNPAIVSAKFNQNFRIRGSENWQGAQYAAFRSYHPQWHDRGWWHSHHNHIILIGGGWYFWNIGYWYPAWGYDRAAAYYPYDGPIYVGNNPTPFDQIVADVQTTLQEQGYYHGEVDGLVGSLTQEALENYQRAQGLEATAAIDEPTLAALGLNG